MMLHRASTASGLGAILVLCWVSCVSGDYPICIPGFLASDDANSMEIFDPSEVGDEVTFTPVCSELQEPKATVTVESSLQNTFSTLEYLDERKYYWGHVCEGENATLAHNYSANLPSGSNGGWTSKPRGTPNPQPLPLGATCRFFGCYTYSIRILVDTAPVTFNNTYHVFNFNPSSCVIDRDECQEDTAGCHHKCVNIMSGTSNSYKCECRDGFSLGEDLHSCTDIDECATDYHGCDQTCSNSVGWYNCSCHDGYTLNEDEHTCDDIDECSVSDVCASQSTGHECTNTPGSFECSCPSGYQFSEERMCTDIDECAMNLCQHECNNTEGGYNCSCYQWYSMNGPHNCTEVDVCAGVECGSHSECVFSPESEEGFRCVCESGYTQSGSSCTLRALVHVYWTVTLVVVVSIVLILGFASFAIHKFHQNKRDVVKNRNLLFKYQLKREEVDPSYNPLGFDPVRKVSYTFSLVSTFETYEYPSSPIVQRPDVTIDDIDANYNTRLCSLSDGQLAVPEEEDELTKRELSIILEDNEDAVSNVSENRAADRQTDLSKVVDSRLGRDTSVTGYVGLEATNPAALLLEGMSQQLGEEDNQGENFAEDLDVFLPAENLTQKFCTGYVMEDGLAEKRESGESGGENVGVNTVEQSKSGPYIPVEALHTSSRAGVDMEQLPLAELPSGTEDVPLNLPFTTTLGTRKNADIDGYIPSNSSTTSSGYGSESVASSSYKSRFLSTSSYNTDTSVGVSSCYYIPSNLSTTSSGYASESGTQPSHKRGSLSSQCDTPRMPQFGSSWTNGGYITDPSLCDSPPLGLAGRSEDSDQLTQSLEPSQPQKHSQRHEDRADSPMTTEPCADSVFSEHHTTPSTGDITSESRGSSASTPDSDHNGQNGVCAGYIPYPRYSKCTPTTTDLRDTLNLEADVCETYYYDREPRIAGRRSGVVTAPQLYTSHETNSVTVASTDYVGYHNNAPPTTTRDTLHEQGSCPTTSECQQTNIKSLSPNVAWSLKEGYVVIDPGCVTQSHGTLHAVTSVSAH